jgi:hypothetical protein
MALADSTARKQVIGVGKGEPMENGDSHCIRACGACSGQSKSDLPVTGIRSRLGKQSVRPFGLAGRLGAMPRRVACRRASRSYPASFHKERVLLAERRA